MDAIASGKRAAESIHRFLSGHDLKTDRVGAGAGVALKSAAVDNIPINGRLEPASEVDQRLPIAQRPLTEDEQLPKPRVPMPELPLDLRLQSFAEVEFGYSAEQAVAEARRCLACGPCSECMACVEACKPQAVLHHQHPTAVALDVGAIIYAGAPQRFEDLPVTAGRGIYRVPPQDLLSGSATAARAVSEGRMVSQPQPLNPAAGFISGRHRTGILICRCGDAIASTVDVDAVRRHAATLTDVVCAEILPFSCTHEAGNIISEMVSCLDLNSVVLAACACCSLDQVCYSCTFQRLRCKQNFGLFDLLPPMPSPVQADTGRPDGPVMVEFVNIREQCAWVHRDDPPAATAKAFDLIAATVAKIQNAPSKFPESPPVERSVLILGGGQAAEVCRDHLQMRHITVRQTNAHPSRIRRENGCYAVRQNGHTQTAAAMVLTPREPSEAEALVNAFGSESHQPRLHSTWGGLETHLPGVFYCDPGADDALTGAAAAARAAAWLGRCSSQVKPHAAVVDAHLCRACQSCVETCEFGAPHIVGPADDRSAWVDPGVCAGCGTCAAQCPSGAITAGYASDQQLAVMIAAILTEEAMIDENK